MYVCIHYILLNTYVQPAPNQYNVACKYYFRAGTLVLDDKLICSSIREDYISQTQDSFVVYSSLCMAEISPAHISMLLSLFSSWLGSHVGKMLRVYSYKLYLTTNTHTHSPVILGKHQIIWFLVGFFKHPQCCLWLLQFFPSVLFAFTTPHLKFLHFLSSPLHRTCDLLSHPLDLLMFSPSIFSLS